MANTRQMPASSSLRKCSSTSAIVMVTGGAIIKLSMEEEVSQGGGHVVDMRGRTSGGDAPAASSSRPSLFGKPFAYWVLMAVSTLTLLVGSSFATILGRFYFMHGGSRRWLYTCIQSAGWPVNVPPLLLCYWRTRARPTRVTPKLLACYTAMGLLTAFDNLLFSWGLSYLPLSTNTLLCASQLAFNAVFSYLIVGQKVTAFAVNAVFSITMGAILLGVYTGTDRPAGTTQRQYALGFIVTVAGSALYALMLPLTERIYKTVIGRRDFVVVVESQTAISVIATLFSLVGMWATGDFAAMRQEATAAFDLGPTVYALTLVGSAIGWQWFFVGGAGIIFLASSLLSCVLMSAMLPLLSLLAVVFLHDQFSVLKGIAMILSMWGFISYIYGGYLHSRTHNAVEPSPSIPPSPLPSHVVPPPPSPPPQPLTHHTLPPPLPHRIPPPLQRQGSLSMHTSPL